MRRLSISEISIITIAAVLVALTLAPAVARMQRSYAEAKCQSNMRRIAEAMALYVTDNSGRYPTNRVKDPSTGAALNVDPDLPLSNPTANPPIRFQYGYNWVEALYPYMQSAAATTGSDWKTFLKCPNALLKSLPGASYSMNPSVSYAFNIYLVEYWQGLAHSSEKLIMCREMDRLVGASLRPSNDYIVQYGFRNLNLGSIADTPKTAFLADGLDGLCRPASSNPHLTYRVHAQGSHILFADGHVGAFTSEYMPTTTTASASWSSETRQWFNFKPNNTATGAPPQYLQGSIAISP